MGYRNAYPRGTIGRSGVGCSDGVEKSTQKSESGGSEWCDVEEYEGNTLLRRTYESVS